MSFLFLIALIVSIVFLVLTIKAAIKKGNVKKNLIICVVAFILAVLFAMMTPESDSSSGTGESAQTQDQSEAAVNTDKADTEVDADTDADIDANTNNDAENATDATDAKSTSAENSDTDQTTDTEKPLTIEIVAGEFGEYGQPVILNENTDSALERIGYFIPAGTYEIENVGEYMTQATIYKNEKIVTDAGWEEWADAYAERIDIGETVTMSIEDGYFFNCLEPSHLILTKIN